MIEVPLQLMLPDTHNPPAERTEFAEVASVTVAVGVEFVAPKGGELVFPCREPPAVPEIAIHKHRDPLTRENDVGPTGKRADMAPEP